MEQSLPTLPLTKVTGGYENVEVESEEWGGGQWRIQTFR